MRPIRDIADIRVDSVLYHSAFGFTRVVHVGPTQVDVEWEKEGDNLPHSVSLDNLRRVYALCTNDGFFYQAVHAPRSMANLLQVNPPQAMELLLEDLQGPQRKRDIREWLVSRNLLSERAFDPWWQRLASVITTDDRFHLEQDTLYLERGVDLVGPVGRLKTGTLSPGRRIDLALATREELETDFFVEQVVLAWRTGGVQVRDLALATLQSQSGEAVFKALLAPGPDNLDALIHLLRHSTWRPEDLPATIHEGLLQRVLAGINDGGPLDNEGRLAATLVRWKCPGIINKFAKLAEVSDGRRLLEATFAALPPRRAESYALELMGVTLANDDAESTQWLGNEALTFNRLDAADMADTLATGNPSLAEWFVNDYRNIAEDVRQEYEDYTEDTAFTAEFDVGIVQGPLPLNEWPWLSGNSIMKIGLAFTRALAQKHKKGIVANPTETSVFVLPDESIEIHEPDDPSMSPRPLTEEPSLTADVYAAAVLLLEGMFRRPWPRNIPASRCLPYLRTILPLIPPSVLSCLLSALHPDPTKRTADAQEWLVQWQQVVITEEARTKAIYNAEAMIEFGLDSHIGRAKILSSQTNQDAVFAATYGTNSLMVVCDGISTANAGSGDVASGIASQIVANLWEQALPRLNDASAADMRDFLDRSMRMANLAVCEAALRLAGGSLEGRVPMGTTVVVVICKGNWVSIGWLGDSRCYLIGPYGAALVTADDNQAGERLRGWHLGYQDRWDGTGHALVGYLGHFNEMNQPEPLPAHHVSFTLLEGERLVLCSDGVTDYIADNNPEIGRILANTIMANDDLYKAASQLVDIANCAGGGDNTTCIVAGIGH